MQTELQRPVAVIAISAALLGLTALGNQTEEAFQGPTAAQTLALSADGQLLAVANPDNDTVSFFDVGLDRNTKIAEIEVQDEPNGVTLTPAGDKVYVANTGSGTVSVIRIDRSARRVSAPFKHISVGTEPYGIVSTPNGSRIYVTNARSNNISVIDCASDEVLATSRTAYGEPRGIAITNDGDSDDTDETAVITHFLAIPRPGRLDGDDDSKTGIVSFMTLSNNVVFSATRIAPLDDTGFAALGDAIARIAPGSPNDPANFKFKTGAYPNQLNNVVIKGRYAYLPNTGASPNGPVRFDVNTQSLLSAVDVEGRFDINKTINMHKAVAEQPTPRLFITQPWAIAFKARSSEGYVVSAASNILVRVSIDAAGAPSVEKDPANPARVHQIKVGRNPRGIVINRQDTRAYVMNYISRDVSVLKLDDGPETVMATLKSADLPEAGTEAGKIHAGKELYNTSVGEFDPATEGGAPITGRMSNNGWGACSACHPNGLTDNVVWIFPAGPRRTISQHGDFDPSVADRSKMRVLNWSANRDQQEDFESNIRAVSGGPGLIVIEDGVTPDPNVNDFVPLSNAGRRQLKIRGVGGWDALKAYIQFGIRAPISPVRKDDPLVVRGQELFKTANCQQCHGGALWSTSLVRFEPPPGSGIVVAGQVIGELKKVGTFDVAVKNEIRQNAAPPLGADGFVPPSLLSIFISDGTFLHNGAADTIAAVLDNVAHRSAGTNGEDKLASEADRIALGRFIQSIDPTTPPIPAP